MWLVYRIARILGGELDSALLAALLFGLLPVHAEAIAWPAAVDMPLVATLDFAAFYLFIAHRNPVRSISRSALLVYGSPGPSERRDLSGPDCGVRTFPRITGRRAYSPDARAADDLLPGAVRGRDRRLSDPSSTGVGAISRPMVGDHLTYGQALMSMPGALRNLPAATGGSMGGRPGASAASRRQASPRRTSGWRSRSW